MTSETMFSVVIPLYNKEKHITRAVESALNQTYSASEIIIVNDGCTDNSVHEIEKFKPKVTILHQKNQGESAARNSGIRLAKHDYIAFLDADDEWLPSFLSNIEEMIKQAPNKKIYCTNYYKKRNGSMRPAINPKDSGFSTIDYFSEARKGNSPVSSSSCCAHKSLFIETGFFPVGVQLYPDLYMWTKASILNPIIFHYQPLAIYHRDAENRACDNLTPTPNDTPFEKIILDAEKSYALQGKRLLHAKEFLCHYKLLNAFKAMTTFRKDDAREILRSTEPMTAKQAIKKKTYQIACVFPENLLNLTWKTGRRIRPNK